MQTVTFVVGLPGSGKSYFANKLINETVRILTEQDPNAYIVSTIIVDDPKDFNQDIKPFLETGCNLYIADHTLCDGVYRYKATDLLNRLYPHVEIQWIYFENKPIICTRNAMHRMALGDNRDVFATIERYADIYIIPLDATVVPVVDATRL